MAELTGQAMSPDRVFGTKAGNSCKSEPSHDSAGNSPLCPQCGSPKVWKDGNRTSSFGDVIQRWLCKKCSLRFSDPKQQAILEAKSAKLKASNGLTKSIKTQGTLLLNRQIRAPNKEAKNLEPEQTIIEVPEMNKDAKGMLVQYEAKMLLEGYGAQTIRGALSCLRALLARNADLMNPESVKKALATEEAKKERNEKCWSQNRRRNVINAYTLFLKFQNQSWIKPKCTVDSKLPFIPQETEIDTIIAGSYKKLATFLQLLKETAFRCGEAHRLEWTDIDMQRRLITLNKPEKHSNARIMEVSQQLIEMLNNLPRKDTHVFPCSLKGMKVTFSKARKRLAQKIGNPRLIAIHFHTFRHWKATMLYHQTKDIYYVKNFLGHKSVKNTEIYITVEHAIYQSGGPDQKFTVRVTKDPQEIAELIADGFEEATKQGDLIYLRKRK